MKKGAKILKFIDSKGKNKRIHIFLLEDELGEKAFNVVTRTLIDFKSRSIVNTNSLYSVETFFVLSNLMSFFMDDPEVGNKILLKEINKIQKFTANTNLKSKP